MAHFTAENLPPLGQFRGRSHGRLDVASGGPGAGGCRRAELLESVAGTVGANRRIHGNPGLCILDNNAAGIASDITVTSGGPLRDIVVPVHISHTFRGDLRVTLEPPFGGVIVSNNERDDDLRQSFTPADTPGLQQLVTQAIDIHGL